MDTINKNTALLPAGFVDLLPPDAEREYTAIGKMMTVFAAFGYERIKPPLLEFEDSLFAPGPGAAVIDDTFRVMDPVSHRMMGVRSDITPQIARIASSRLKSESRPLRVCYANDVLRTKASQQRTERQFTQVGCEIVGEKDIEADIESCVVALIGLEVLGVKNVTIDLAYPALLKKILGRTGLSDKIARALESRRKDGVPAILKKLMECAGPAEAALKKLKTLKMKFIAKETAELAAIVAGLQRAAGELKFKNLQITVDPVETRGLRYYSGAGFTLFAKGIAGALGRGGRYAIHKETACGFTLYMDTVRKAMPPARQTKIITVGAGENWAKIRAEQQKGVIVVRGKRKK